MAPYGLWRHLREQLRALPRPQAVDNADSKTFIVTGSNVGLGFEASVHLARIGPKLLISTSRDSVKCEQTQKAILERVSGLSSAQVSAWPLEMGSFDNVRAFANKFTAEGHQTLDTLLANAGVYTNDYKQTPDGWETMLQVNYLSTALLSILFLPYLIKASSPDSPSRLVLVSSSAHYFPKEVNEADKWKSIFDTVNQPEFANSATRYCVSKLMGVAFVRELASHLPEPTPVIVCSVDPGVSKSQIFRNQRSRLLSPLMWLPVRTTEEGSRTLVHGAIASDRSMHGRYLASCRIATENDFLFTPAGKMFSKRVWDETIALLSTTDDRVPDIVAKYLRVDDGHK